MTKPRKHGQGLPQRVEARVWLNGTTVTYRYLAPTGEKIYLGTDREQALAAYDQLVRKHPAAQADPKVEASIRRYREAPSAPGAPVVRFHARATLNSHGNESVPTGFRTNENRHR